jgi:uncharacterized LabA/DUF88 family protein
VGKNVAVFVDVANIFYAAKAAGVDIDYVTLLKSASAGRDLVRAYAYTGLDPDNENQRNFHDFLRRSNYKVVSKDIRKYGDGKVKANLDIELVVDMMKTARNLDIAIVVSGDGDFAPAIRAVQEQGVRVEVISFRGNTSSDLIEVADQFTDIVQLARVEKGSRSGRRVSDDDADLSMTEVPDKQTEGAGGSRGRGRGRGRGRAGEAEPVVAAASRGRGRGRPTAGIASPAAAAAAASGAIVALPGERLSKAPGTLSEADLAAAEVFTLDDDVDGSDEAAPGTSVPTGVDGDDATRRRRRRGGRGRGRGRGRGEGEPAPQSSGNGAGSRPAPIIEDVEDDDLEESAAAPKAPRANPFGSVWDSQLGTPTSAPASANLAPLADDDLDEPEIPEYLIAEQRRGPNLRSGQGGNRGPRGGRAAYQSAIARERYGRGGGGINRYPDVSARTAAPREERPYGGDRQSQGDRHDRGDRTPAPRRGSGEWSEVPPELEAQLRAQLASKPSVPTPSPESVTSHPEPVAAAAAEPAAESPESTAPKRRAPSKSSSTATKAKASSAKTSAAAKPATSKSRTAGKAATASAAAVDAADAAAPKAAPKSRTPRKTSTTAATSDGGEVGPKAAPKRRATAKPAAD